MKDENLRKLLAEELLNYKIGDRIPTVREFSDTFKSSVGSVQSTLTYFENEKIFTYDRRGHLGSYLTSISIRKVWKIINLGKPLVVSLPLPTTSICEGLATAIKYELSRSGIEVYLTFLRGSKRRLSTLRQGRCDLIVNSKFDAEMNSLENEEIYLELPPRTYVREHKVYYTGMPFPDGANPFRVIMDSDSMDLQRLTELEFEGLQVVNIPASFMQIPPYLSDGRVDAAIWDIDEAEKKLPDAIHERPISKRVLEQIGSTPYMATLVGKKGNLAIKNVVDNCINKENILHIQKEVMNKTRLPEY
jgi:hypothetical protein